MRQAVLLFSVFRYGALRDSVSNLFQLFEKYVFRTALSVYSFEYSWQHYILLGIEGGIKTEGSKDFYVYQRNLKIFQ